MKVLVTGGAGFIGSNLASALLLEGHEVRVLDNLQSGYEKNLAGLDEVEFIRGDVRDASAVWEAMESREVVFHLAASVGNKRSIDDPIADSEINVLGTLRVLEAARRRGVRKIVASSSAGIYGELRHVPIAESHRVEPLTPYGSSKLCMEKQCLAYAYVHGLEAACLRYFNVYGPNQRYDAYGNVIPIFVFRALAGEPIIVFGDGEQTRDFVNVRDVVRANIAAAAPGLATAAFNVASGTQITILELAQRVRDLVGGDVQITHGSERPGDVRHSLADISLAERTVGYAPAVTIEDGLPEYVEWARALVTGGEGRPRELA